MILLNSSKVMSLWCSVKNYHWGKKGSESLVGRLAVNSCKNFILKDDTPYAELWMGTHPSGPAYVTEEGEDGPKDVLLSDLLKATPGYSGTMRIYEKFGSDFPFLLKVLSVNEPLSIQSHPDKQLAQVLHSRDPKNYPDDNHKPEMAIALTHFQALCSFRTHHELQQIISNVNELLSLIPNETIEHYLNASDEEQKTVGLKAIFSCFMNCDEYSRDDVIQKLYKRYNDRDFEARCPLESDLRKLFIHVHKYYPRDVGCLCMFLLNHVELNPGEAIFLAANEPHCYISGDCVECMAKSDNVIRAGFTPKFKDVQTLCHSLTYKTADRNDLLLKPRVMENNNYCHIYSPPVEEFAVEKIEITRDQEKEASRITLDKRDSGSILIVIKGKLYRDGSHEELKSGSVNFIAAMISVSFLVKETDLLCFRAYSNCLSRL